MMMQTAMIPLLFALLACSLPTLEAAQCMPDETNPCKAKCNGTLFDISKVFDYPINITEPTARGSPPRVYWYMWDPCRGYKCPEGGPDSNCAVCQKADVFLSCGKPTTPIFLWELPGLSILDGFPSWKIQYTFGDGWRISIFNFIVDEKQKEPTVRFISEDPYLQYNFEVRGKCIGQQTFECTHQN